MTPTLVMLIALFSGMAVVIGGILVLKLEPFLALILGALAVGCLTPQSAMLRYAQDKERLKIVARDQEAGTVSLQAPATAGLRPGAAVLVVQAEDDQAPFREIGELRISASDGRRYVVQPGTQELPEFGHNLALMTPAGLANAAKQAQQSVPDRIARGFGNTCASIGILIAMASIIGKCLLDSGAADRIVRSFVRICGERGAPVAFLGSGFLLAIPVFFDTVFYLMVPLAKAMRLRTGRSYLLYVMAIFTGGTMAHSLVPPTPGPLFVAEALHVELGLMILVGGVIGLFTSTAGYLAAIVINRNLEVPLRESPDFSLEELTRTLEQPDSTLPPLWLSLLPILLPVVLIGGQAVLPYFGERLPVQVHHFWNIFGDKNLALMIAAGIAIIMLVAQRRTTLSQLRPALQSALGSAGSIILITAAGGAFGTLLQETGVASLIRHLPTTSTPVVIILGFLVTAVIRTAQGSATVAMITSVGILGSFAASGELACHPVYLAIAIGCGSKPLSWMNDSGFWIISRLAGMTEAETLKTVTPLSGIMGFTGLIVTLIGATLFPLL